MAARCVTERCSQMLTHGPLHLLPGLPGLTLVRTLCLSSLQLGARRYTGRPTLADRPVVKMPQGDDRPHMLHVVWRIRSTKRRPYWERDVIKQLMLERNFFPVVHKNTESVNALLRQVRHLVRIKPLVLKHGLPHGDYDSTLLKWNGEFVVRRKLNSLGQEVVTDGGEELKGRQEAGAEKEPARDPESR
ncbi:39S ribosomal protein L30, mitochondrial-like [Acanthaster planci]|uniref:Large ribosomal subunit protein uL30m n=1 Tax=Acanthaster planci TaxID=133434 RepID=A0A8B7Y3K4_ACAPL|nr:39S ribosomal protein L30, mitochondrial-like [Acanthaster planci]